jgi:hypothetical protein
LVENVARLWRQCVENFGEKPHKIPHGNPSKRRKDMDFTEIGCGDERWMEFATVTRYDISGVLFSD